MNQKVVSQVLHREGRKSSMVVNHKDFLNHKHRVRCVTQNGKSLIGDLVQFSPRSRDVPIVVSTYRGQMVEMISRDELVYIAFDRTKNPPLVVDMTPHLKQAQITCSNGDSFDVLIRQGAEDEPIGFFGFDGDRQPVIFFYSARLSRLSLSSDEGPVTLVDRSFESIGSEQDGEAAHAPHSEQVGRLSSPINADGQPKIIWQGSEIPALIRMLRRELESRSADVQRDGLDTMHHVNLMSVVKAVINEIYSVGDVELHLNSAMHCRFGSMRYVHNNKTVWSLPVPDAICDELIATFRVLSMINADGNHHGKVYSMRWRIGTHIDAVKVMEKPAEGGGQRLVVWIASRHQD